MLDAIVLEDVDTVQATGTAPVEISWIDVDPAPVTDAASLPEPGAINFG